jgi:hypothetical protein
MMLAALGLAAAVQSGQPAVARPSAPAPSSAEVKTALACQTPGKVIAKTPGAPVSAFHTLNQEPDAAMIKPVARNYCEPSDVIRTNVSGDTATAVRPPRTVVPPRIAR